MVISATKTDSNKNMHSHLCVFYYTVHHQIDPQQSRHTQHAFYIGGERRAKNVLPLSSEASPPPPSVGGREGTPPPSPPHREASSSLTSSSRQITDRGRLGEARPRRGAACGARRIPPSPAPSIAGPSTAAASRRSTGRREARPYPYSPSSAPSPAAEHRWRLGARRGKRRGVWVWGRG